MAYGSGAILMLMSGQVAIAIPLILAMFAMFLCGVLLRTGRPIAIAANLVIAACATVILGMLSLTGGSSVGFLIATPIVPTLAALLTDWRSSLSWTAVTASTIFGVMGLAVLGFEFPLRVNSTAVTLIKFPVTVIVIGVILGFLWLFERQRRHHEQALGQSTQSEEHVHRQTSLQLQTLMGNAPVAIISTNLDGQIRDANPMMLETLGLTAHELRSKHFSEIVHPDDLKLVMRKTQKILDGKATELSEFRCLRSDGSFVLVRSMNWLVSGTTDFPETSFLVGVMGPTGELPPAQCELKAQQDHLEPVVEERAKALQRSREQLFVSERLKSIGTFAAGIAHEINNPLAAILNGAQLALVRGDEPDCQVQYREALEENIYQAKRCGEIVRHVLQFAQGESAKKEDIEIADVVRTACDRTQAYAKSRNATIDVEMKETVGPIHASRIEFVQVLVNVIRNAVESRPYGASVRICCSRVGSNVEIEVADDGCGIPDDALKHVFDPFHSSRQADGGTGLGLSVTYGIVADHAGQISVRSVRGLGTRISIEVALATAL
jgi:PAS domain S-box-containing protein